MTQQKQIVPFDPASAEDRRLVAEHVEKLLANPLFRLSRRLPMFLQYIVHLALESHDSAPKERTLGIEVFGRRPDYDTNADPVVRMTATELRKKLAQYYHADGRDDLVEIELPPGSYLPRFRRLAAAGEASLSAERAALPAASPVTVPAVQSAAEAPTALSVVQPETVTAHPSEPQVAAQATRATPNPWRYTVLLLVVLLAIVSVGLIAALRRPYSPSAAFWRSFAGSTGSVTVVMPVIGKLGQTPEPTPGDISVAPNLSLEDTTIAARVAGQLERNDLGYFITSSREINFAQLRTGPAILIGALDNEWTMRLGQELPFGFQQSSDGHTGLITERGAGPQLRNWSINISTPHRRIGEDFGVVACFHSRLTGEPVLVVAGISSQGTQAAGELLTTPATLNRLLAGVHGAQNFEWVIETQAVDGRAGPPQIVAAKTW